MAEKRGTGRGPLVRCRSGWLAALAGGLVAFTATPAIAAPGADLARCVQEVQAAGLLGPQTNPGQANYILGTEGDDNFSGRVTEGVDVICGFAGDDILNFLSDDDVFLGGAGNDAVILQNGGTFNGGAGNDTLVSLDAGTFNGGAGNDVVAVQNGGTFNGGAGNDHVNVQLGGTFNGGDGNDTVNLHVGGTFNGGDGIDVVHHPLGGTFNP